jgi:hypothetical protein
MCRAAAGVGDGRRESGRQAGGRVAPPARTLARGGSHRIGIPLGDYPFPDVFKAMDVSVAELSPEAQARYRRLSVFPDDAHVPRTRWPSFGDSTASRWTI